MTLIAASRPRCVHAYGLTADDLAHILFTFPVFARKCPAFYAYLLACVKEWQEETGTVGRRRYSSSRDSETPLPQAAEDVSRYETRGSPD